MLPDADAGLRNVAAPPMLLVVDDDPLNRRTLRALLEREGYSVVEAEDGAEALARLDRARPDAVLLDVEMPGMDGIEVLRRIKDSDGQFIPVMMVSGCDEQGLAERAVRRGADDFVPRPFERADLLRRLETLLDVREHRRQLAQRHTQLAALEEYRQDLAQLLVHDLKSPLSVIHGNLSYLSETIDAGPDAKEALADARDATSVLQRMICNLVDVGLAEHESLALVRAPVDVAELLAQVARGREREVRLRGAAIEVSAAPVTVSADRDVLRRVVENLVENALRFAGGGRIALRARVEGEQVEIEVANTGPPVPVEFRRLVFEKYGQTRRRSGMPRVDLGLGLYFCRLVVEAHGGSISVEERPEFPTTFVITLPLS